MKTKVYAFGDRGDGYFYIIFEKRQEIFKLLKRMLLEMGEYAPIINSMIYGTEPDALVEEPKLRKLSELNIKSIKDRLYHFHAGSHKVDIILGDDRVFFIGHMEKEHRDKVRTLLQKECEFVKS